MQPGAMAEQRARSEWSELDDISVELRSNLNVPNLRPFLRARHILTEAELEQVEISAANPTGQAIDKLVSILKTKGPNHSVEFLEVLKLSLKEEDSHLGHVFLCEKLDAAIKEKKCRDMESLRQAVRHIPVHRPTRDSGLGHFGMSSNGSSPETVSISSSATESLIGHPINGRATRNETDDRALILLPNRGLDNLENERRHHPGLDERQVSSLKHKIAKDNDSIISRFAVMVVGVYRLLKQKNAPVDEVRLMLQFLGCHPGKSRESNTNLFSETDGFSESKDLLTLIECLRKYSSWYNYRLMKEVAEHFAGEEGKELISDYEDDLRKHYVDLIAYQCPDFSLAKGVPPGYTRLTVKVDWDYMSTNLQHITLFQSSLADILNLEPYVFQLRSVEEGCVRLDWAVPAALESHVANMMVEKEECLREHRVLYLEIASAKKVVIDKHSLPLKVEPHVPYPWIPSLACLHSPKLQTLSTSSSISSVLDVPMSLTEAELLSVYSGGSIDGESLLSISMEENLPGVHQDNGEGDLGFSSSPSATDIAPIGTFSSTATQMKHASCSEGDLLMTSPPALRKEGLSLPNIAENVVTAMPENSGRMCRQRSVMRSLRKLPKTILKRLHHTSSKVENQKSPDSGLSKLQSEPPSQPFPLLQLIDEPRKLTNYQDKLQVAVYNYTLPCISIDNWQAAALLPVPVIDSNTPSFTVDKKEVSLTDLSHSVHLWTSSDSPISLHSPSPINTPLSASKSARENGTSRESGVGSSFSSHSSNRPFIKHNRQPSMESVVSVGTISQASTKRNSYTSHHYVNVSYPIYENPTDEDPADDVTTPHQSVDSTLPMETPLPQYAPIPPRELSDSWEVRNRSQSHGEEYYNRVQPNRVSSSNSSAESSGYSSYASSMARVDAPTHSQESLNSESMLPSTRLPHGSGPFPPRPPRPGSVRRGGSLKATSHFSTFHSQPPRNIHTCNFKDKLP